MTPWSDTPNMAGIKGRSGPPKGNLNAARTGQSITRLTLGELPATMHRQTQQARKYRRGLEALVVEAKGQVDATDAHLIDEAARRRSTRRCVPLVAPHPHRQDERERRGPVLRTDCKGQGGAQPGR